MKQFKVGQKVTVHRNIGSSGIHWVPGEYRGVVSEEGHRFHAVKIEWGDYTEIVHVWDEDIRAIEFH